MKQLTAMSLLILSAPVWASASAPIDLWQTDFSNGKFPQGITTSAFKEALPLKDRYKNGYTVEGWSVKAVGSTYCALSPTATGVDIPCDNVLSLPKISVPEDAEGVMLRWTARSILPGLSEAYEVSIRNAAGGDWVKLLRVDEEKDIFTSHVLMLDDYAGQDVEIRFSCVSTNRYMLAISDIYVGVPSTPLLKGEAVTPRFAENASPREIVFNVLGEYLNCGASIPAGAKVEVRVSGAASASWILPSDCQSGESLSFEIPFEAPDNTTTPYEVWLVMPDGSESKICQSDVTRSGFARKLLVDEATGIWCNNCPAGTLEVASLMREYPGQLIPVCTHINDIIANDEYYSNLGFYAIPYFMLNRISDSKYSSTKNFASYVKDPTFASISVVEGPEPGSEDVTVKLEMMFSKEVADYTRYGIGYVFTSPFHYKTLDGSWMQKNNLTSAKYEQYYFLPSVIPNNLCFYDHVSLGSENAFDPITPSWPVDGYTISAYTPGSLELNFGDLFSSLDDPEEGNPEDISLVVYVLDRESGVVLNAESYPLQQAYKGVHVGAENIAAEREMTLSVVDGSARFNLPESPVEYNIFVSDITGRVIFRYTGKDSGSASCQLPAANGVNIVTLVSAEGSKSVKYVR